MVSDKESIGRLVYIAKAKGIKHVVFSPGSRNAPLIVSFDSDPHFNCINIPDERVAAFFAMGLALKTGKPVIICCTSGSAVLNYAPAIAESYYQQIPLLVITADRPVEWIDQGVGQTIRQKNVYQNYIRKSFELIEDSNHQDHLWYNDRIVNEAIDSAMMSPQGPVHINVPLMEPLYKQKATIDHEPKIIHTFRKLTTLGPVDEANLKAKFLSQDKILVISGQHQPSDEWKNALVSMAAYDHVAILSETTSNVSDDRIISCVDRTIDSISDTEISEFAPSLLITCGGAIVSNKIRFLLRKMDIKDHWHIDPDEHFVDTYQSLTLNIPLTFEDFFKYISDSLKGKSCASSYSAQWSDRSLLTQQNHLKFFNKIEWSDLSVVNSVIEHLPRPSVLHMANSTAVRYVQLFDNDDDIEYQCNRGVSGIDGSTSTAAGFAYRDDRINTLITGDMAFFYDSNALWHSNLPDNLRIIILNNSGGNIFRIIPGPDQTEQLAKHFEAHHSTCAKDIAGAHGIRYLSVHDPDSLKKGLVDLFGSEIQEPMILEVFTPRFINDKVLKQYFQSLT